MTDELPQARQCKVCNLLQPIENFCHNPHTKDPAKRSAVCNGCRGKSTLTVRGQARAARERRESRNTDDLLNELFEVFKSGDQAKDFFIKQLLRIALVGKNEQAQLSAIKALSEFKGMDKEAPADQRDLIHSAFTRMKKQREEVVPSDTKN